MKFGMPKEMSLFNNKVYVYDYSTFRSEDTRS